MLATHSQFDLLIRRRAIDISARSRQVCTLNLVGAADLIVNYVHGNQIGLPALAGELGAA